MSSKAYIIGFIVLVSIQCAIFAHYLHEENKAAMTDEPIIMIRKDSLERILRNPCMVGTIEYMGNYMLCKRRADYEPRERRYWPSPYPEKS